MSSFFFILQKVINIVFFLIVVSEVSSFVGNPVIQGVLINLSEDTLGSCLLRISNIQNDKVPFLK